MKTVDVSIDSKRPIAVWLLSDLHIGHKAFDQELFDRHREAAKRARARVLFLGDALEAVTTGSKVANLGGHFDQIGSIGEQADQFVEYMKGFRVLSTVEGNHERRVTRTTGRSPLHDINKDLARQQRYPCGFFPHGGFVRITVGKQRYTLVVHHGEGGPTTFFRSLMKDFIGADAYFGGHTHQLSTEEVLVHTADGPKRVLTARTGSYLHLPAYACDKPSTYGVPATGSWLLWLRPDRKQLTLEKMSDRLEGAA